MPMRINEINFSKSQIRWNLQRSMELVKEQRLIEGFYYYLHREKAGDRSKGWLMMAHDKIDGSILHPAPFPENPCDNCPEGVTATWVCEKSPQCLPWLKWFKAATIKEASEDVSNRLKGFHSELKAESEIELIEEQKELTEGLKEALEILYRWFP